MKLHHSVGNYFKKSLDNYLTHGMIMSFTHLRSYTMNTISVSDEQQVKSYINDLVSRGVIYATVIWGKSTDYEIDDGYKLTCIPYGAEIWKITVYDDGTIECHTDVEVRDVDKTILSNGLSGYRFNSFADIQVEAV